MAKTLKLPDLIPGLLSLSIIALIGLIYANNRDAEALSETVARSEHRNDRIYGSIDPQHETGKDESVGGSRRERYEMTIRQLKSLIRARAGLLGKAEYIDLPGPVQTEEQAGMEERSHIHYDSFLDRRGLSESQEDTFRMLMIERWHLLEDISGLAWRLTKAPQKTRA